MGLPLGVPRRTPPAHTASSGRFTNIRTSNHARRAYRTYLTSAAGMNTLTKKLMSEFDGLLSDLESDKSVKAAVLISDKPDNFIAGAPRLPPPLRLSAAAACSSPCLCLCK